MQEMPKAAKLEKQTEREIAKAKNEANKKMFAMQVIQAVAQTAQNAISAYGSAAAIQYIPCPNRIMTFSLSQRLRRWCIFEHSFYVVV